MKKKRIVTIGGGTGHFTLLTAVRELWKEFPHLMATAVVTATDSGGSSGRLRKERDMLPPGDIIQCLLALSESLDREFLIRLLRRRFTGRKGAKKLGGHSVGNFLMTMLKEHTGNIHESLRGMHQILEVRRGEVLPVTFENIQLCAETESGEHIDGEASIDTRGKNALACDETTLSPIKRVWLDKNVRADSHVLERIREATVILFGPGDLWTSLIPTLLPNGVVQAIGDSHAVKVFIANIMTKFGETDNYSTDNFLKVIEGVLGKEGIIDHVIYNSVSIPGEVAERYARENAFSIPLANTNRTRPLFHGRNLVSPRSTLARHDPNKLYVALEELLRAQLSS